MPHVPEILLPCIKVLELHDQKISLDPIEQTVAGSLNTQLSAGDIIEAANDLLQTIRTKHRHLQLLQKDLDL